MVDQVAELLLVQHLVDGVEARPCAGRCPTAARGPRWSPCACRRCGRRPSPAGPPRRGRTRRAPPSGDANTRPSPLANSRGAGHVVDAEHHVLRGDDDGLAVRGAEDVVGRHHQHARFHLSFDGERHVHGHLVTVEVGVERRADQRVELDGLAFDEHGLERLHAQAVQRGSAVQEHRVLADDVLEDVPDLGTLLLHHLLRAT